MYFPKGLLSYANVRDIAIDGAVKGYNPADPASVSANVTANNLAFRNAFIYCINNGNRSLFPKKIFVENGTYCVSEITSRVGASGINPSTGQTYFSDGWRYGMQIVGESMEDTILYLPPNTPGFQDPLNPKPLIVTGSEQDSGLTDQTNPTGKGNAAFRFYFDNLTIVIGGGNPGAVAMDLVINNMGGMQNVRIVDEENTALCAIGLVRAWAGPSIFENIYIEGFKDQIRATRGFEDGVTAYDYQQTISRFVSVKPRRYSIYTTGVPVAIEGLTLYADVDNPLRFTGSFGITTIIDSTFHASKIANSSLVGQAPAKQEGLTAIKNSSTLLLRRVTNYGYGTTLMDTSVTPTAVKDAYIEEYRSLSIPNLVTDKIYRSLKLRGRPTPVIYSSAISDYVNVNAFADADNTTDTQIIQRAINLAQERIIILPNRQYNIRQSIVLKSLVGNKRLKLWGMCARVTSDTGYTVSMNFVGEMGADETVILEDIRFGSIRHNGAGTMVIKRCQLVSITNTELSGSGWIYLSDIIGCVQLDYPCNVVARQLNSEFQGTNFKMRGGRAWVLSLKTEASPTLQSRNIDVAQGTTAVFLNTNIYPLNNLTKNPSISIENSDVDVFYKHGSGSYLQYVVDSKLGVTKPLTKKNNGFYSARVHN